MSAASRTSVSAIPHFALLSEIQNVLMVAWGWSSTLMIAVPLENVCCKIRNLRQCLLQVVFPWPMACLPKCLDRMMRKPANYLCLKHQQWDQMLWELLTPRHWQTCRFYQKQACASTKAAKNIRMVKRGIRTEIRATFAAVMQKTMLGEMHCFIVVPGSKLSRCINFI